MDIVTGILSGLRIIIGFLFLLFIPGFFLSLVLFPKSSELRLSERLVYPFVMSIGSVIICVLFMDAVLGVDSTPTNIIIVLVGFSLSLVILLIIRRYFLKFSLTEKISVMLKKVRAGYNRVIGNWINGILERYKK